MRISKIKAQMIIGEVKKVILNWSEYAYYDSINEDVIQTIGEHIKSTIGIFEIDS